MLNVKNEQKLLGHVGRVWCIDWSPDGKILASCGEDRDIRLWRKQDNGVWVCTKCIRTHHKRTLRRVRWSSCGKVLAVCSFDGTVSLWSRDNGSSDNDGEEWEVAVTLEGHENEVKSLGWSCDQEWFASCSRDKTVWIWKANGESLDYECASILNSHSQDVKLVVWHPISMTLYSGSYDNCIKSYQVDDDDEWFNESSMTPHTGTIWGLSFSKNGKEAVSCGEDGGLKVWCCVDDNGSLLTLDKWKCLTEFNHDRPVYDVSWSKVDRLIASGCGDNHIRIYGVSGGEYGGEVGVVSERSNIKDAVDCKNSKEEFRMLMEIAQPMDINAVSWNPVTSLCFASAGDDESVVVWQLGCG